ncbi:MAG: ATP-dependent Clp protease ATP-binding subunit [Candidatus Pacebacteria bacterium]|nr:ATP-dependent Clp protease ATP-binding subunit [Candidatus Paceibacterota bacterium]
MPPAKDSTVTNSSQNRFGLSYFEWHYSHIPNRILEATKNFIIFLTHFFSVGFLIRTFFGPWKRQLVKKKSPGLDLGELLETLSYNLISRTIGILTRIILILIWLITTTLTFISGTSFFLAWLILPGFTYLFYCFLKEEKDRIRNLLTDNRLDPEKILSQLTVFPLTAFVLTRLNLNPEKIKTIPIVAAEKNRFQSQLSRFLKKKKIKLTRLTIKDILVFSAQEFLPFKQYLADKDLKPKDIIRVSNWFLRQKRVLRRERAFWQIENLLKIPPLGKDLAFGYTPNLNRYCTNLAQPLPYTHHLVGRQKETIQIQQILARYSGNNVLLVGEPGVGRHTIVEEFAKRVNQGQVIPALAHKRVLGFNLRRLASESKNQMEAKTLVEEALTEAAYAGNIILVIDNFDQYVSPETNRIDLTNVFSQAARKGVQIIGITTFADFAKYLYPNQQLLKEFEKVEASPPTNTEALTILEDTVDYYEKRNQVFVTYQALKEIVSQVDRYIVHIPFPEKAIDLLDEVCVYAAQKGQKIITPKQINQVISEKTKIPLGEIRQDEAERLNNLEKIIHQRLINQEEAVVAIARAMRRTRVGIAKTNRPIGSFLFMGPTGVGKTETAKALAEAYFGNESRMIRFDMSEYQGQDALDRVIGSINTQEPGLFAKTIRENPFSLLLLDEIEKSHPNILNLFLSLLDEGYFTDAFGKKVDCRNQIIIGTSNAGTELIREILKKNSSATDSETLERRVIEYVQKKGIFSPEFLNRFDDMVIFKPLAKKHLLQIAGLMLKQLNSRLEKREIKVKISQKLLERIVELGYDPAFGARPMNRVIQDQIEDQVAQKILSGKLKKGDVVEIEI